MRPDRRSATLALALLPLMGLACQGDPKPDDQQPVDDTSTGDGGGVVDDVRPNFYQDVLPLVAENCWTCHGGSNELAFDLTDPEMVAQLAEWMLTKMEGDDSPPYLMPPYSVDTESCDAGVGFAYDERLSPAQIQLFKDWIAVGTPLGDPAKAAPYEVRPLRDIVGDRIDDLPPMDFSVADGEKGDRYQCWSWNLDLTDDSWMTGLRVNADNTNIIHHAVIMADFSGETAPTPEDDPDGDGSGHCATRQDGSVYPDATMLATWVPGADPIILPPGSAMHFPPGTRLVSSTHYHANGTGQHDGTSMSVAWSDTPPQYEMATLPLGAADDRDDDAEELGDPPFLIPAGATAHEETWIERFATQDRQPVKIWGIFPHAHYAAREMSIAINRMDLKKGVVERQDCLIHVPQFDFNWQRTYEFDAAYEDLPEIDQGDQWALRCVYDNSQSNEILTSAMKNEGIEDYHDIGVGNGSFDEMCIMHVIVQKPYDGRYEKDDKGKGKD